MKSLIVIDAKARKRFVREVAALEEAAADGNTWGPQRDAQILKATLLDGARINERDRRLIAECIADAREDLADHFRNYPSDFAGDERGVRRRLKAMDDLAERL